MSRFCVLSDSMDVSMILGGGRGGCEGANPPPPSCEGCSNPLMSWQRVRQGRRL